MNKTCKVIINQTTLIGTEYPEGLYFGCIPYATTKRFEDPTPFDLGTEYNTNRKAFACHQQSEYKDNSKGNNKDRFFHKEYSSVRNVEYVDSPMALSVRMPHNPKNAPVLVYFHGGSFNNGSYDDIPFGHSWEYVNQGIIQVNVTYRLNVFGLFDTQNYDLKDCVFALQWIYRNIGYFGGNSQHIVIMGESAGAMIVNNLLYVEQIKGMYQAAIMLSGAGIAPRFFAPRTQQQNHYFWEKVMKRAGCNNVEELKKVDPQILWDAWHIEKKTTKNITVKAPGIDGTILKRKPKETVKNNQDNDVPLLIGITSQDMYPFMIYDMALSIAKRNIRRNRSNVYGYMFDYAPPGNLYKAYHTCDLWYCFNDREESWREFTDEDKKLGELMVDYFANFIKNYNPNSDNLAYWPAISRKTHKFRWFSKSKKTLIRPYKCRLKLFHTGIFDKGPI